MPRQATRWSLYSYSAFLAITGLLMVVGSSGSFCQWRFDGSPAAQIYAVTLVKVNEVPGYRFELRPGDCQPYNRVKDCDTGRERVELRSLIEASEGTTYQYTFSVVFPEALPSGIGVIVGQFHDGYVPVLSNRLEGGAWKLIIQTYRNVRDHIVEMQPKGHPIHTFHLHYRIHWSRSHLGKIQAWVNQQLIADYDGPNLSVQGSGRAHLKIGIYRSKVQTDSVPQNLVLWISEPEIKQE